MPTVQFEIDRTQIVNLKAELQGGHTLVALLWYDAFGPGFWNIEPTAVRPGETSWDFGPLGGTWRKRVRNLVQYEARGPYAEQTFRLAPPNAELVDFWIDVRCASNTNAPERQFVVELIAEQNGVAVPARGNVLVVREKAPSLIATDTANIEFLFA